jgi:hypothetical protein
MHLIKTNIMKKIILLALLFVSVSAMFAQTTQREYIIQMNFENRNEIEHISRHVSIDKVEGNTITAYANPRELKVLDSKGYEYKIIPKPDLSNRVINMATTVGEMANWDRYPTHSVYVQMMQDFATNYPAICKLDTIGFTTENRPILVVKISDNVNQQEAEPEVFLTSTMHGDETTGWIIHLRLIDYLLSNYGSNAEVDEIVNNMEVWINPAANPDGTYAGGDNDVSGATRSNANGIDYNRNFPDPEDGEHPDGYSWQPETLAMMAFAEEHSFVLSENSHGGAEVVNYPWDTWSDLHADDDWWQRVSHAYADLCQANSPSGYIDGFDDGITNGYAWYTVAGGRQDYMNYFHHCREFVLELSDTKLLSSDLLPDYYDYNYQSLINYVKEANYGIQGVVTNIDGDPIDAEIRISNHDFDNSYVVTDPDVGDYYRPIEPGTYDVIVIAYGYVNKLIPDVTVTEGTATVLNVILGEATSVTISGVVTDANTGNPIEGATISFDNAPIDDVLTDINGTYTVNEVLEDSYDITISAPDYASIHETINVTASSTTFDFTMNPVTMISFEEATLPDGFTTSGDADWFIDTNEGYHLNQSARSGVITHNQTSTLEYTYNFASASTVSFALKTSVEGTSSFYDFLEFFIDGTSQGRWKGETDWTEVSFEVTEGEHTLTWTYERDVSAGGVEDIVWIDMIMLPEAVEADPIADFSANSLFFQLEDINPTGTQSITLTNTGEGSLTFTNELQDGIWASISSTPIALAADESTSITIDVDASSLVEGDIYYDTLIVTTYETFEIPITLDYARTGINVIDSKELSLYPNPSNGQINMEATSSIIEVNIFDAAGKLVYNEAGDKKYDLTVDTKLKEGVYLIRVLTDNNLITRKIIVQ